MQEHPQFDIRQLLALGRVSSLAPSPCNSYAVVAVSRLDPKQNKFISNLWRVDAHPTKKPSLLTNGEYNDHSPAFQEEDLLTFLSNRPLPPETPPTHNDHQNPPMPPPPARNAQIWTLHLTDPNALPAHLTDEPLGVNSFQWNHNSDLLILEAPVLPNIPHETQRAEDEHIREHGPSALHYTRMPVRHWDHWIPNAAPHLIAYNANGQGRRDLTPLADREHREGQWHLSADGTLLVMTQAHPGPDRLDDQPLCLLQLDNGETRLLSDPPNTTYNNPRISFDGRHVAAIRHSRQKEAKGKPHLVLFDLSNNTETPLLPEWHNTPETLCWSNNHNGLYVTAKEDTATAIFYVDIPTSTLTRLTSPQIRGTHEQIQSSGDLIWGIRHSLLQPPEPFFLKHTPPKTHTLTLLPKLSGLNHEQIQTWVHCEDARATSTDGKQIQYFLLSPKNTDKSKHSKPSLMWIHGGPISHWGDWWHWRWNPLSFLAQGYSLILPNPRGSMGFGQDFIEDIWGNCWGKQCYEDLLAVADHALHTHPELDPSKMAAMGGSFGGYMVNWIGVNTQRFCCLVSHAGLFSALSFSGTTDYPPYWYMANQIDPYQKPLEAETYFAARKMERWKTPTLITHGEKDYRVPIGEGLMLFEALQHHNVPSELLVFPDENHWILKPNNIVVWIETILRFLKLHMK